MSKGFSVLVTGGAGYLGSTLVPALLEAGLRVTVLDNLMFRQTSLNQLCANPGFDFAYGDSRDEATLKPLLAKSDIVVPLAALVGAPLCNRDQVGNGDDESRCNRLLGEADEPGAAAADSHHQQRLRRG